MRTTILSPAVDAAHDHDVLAVEGLHPHGAGQEDLRLLVAENHGLAARRLGQRRTRQHDACHTLAVEGDHRDGRPRIQQRVRFQNLELQDRVLLLQGPAAADELQLDRGTAADGGGRFVDGIGIDLIEDERLDQQAGRIDDLEQLIAWRDDLSGHDASLPR